MCARVAEGRALSRDLLVRSHPRWIQNRYGDLLVGQAGFMADAIQCVGSPVASADPPQPRLDLRRTVGRRRPFAVRLRALRSGLRCRLKQLAA